MNIYIIYLTINTDSSAMGSGLLSKSLKNEIQEIRKKCNKICPVWTYFSFKKKKFVFLPEHLRLEVNITFMKSRESKISAEYNGKYL